MTTFPWTLENDMLLLINKESRKTKQGSSHLSQSKNVFPQCVTCKIYFDLQHTQREIKHELRAGFLGMPVL